MYGLQYYYPIVRLSVRSTVFEIFDFKNHVTMKTGLRESKGHECYHSIESLWLLAASAACERLFSAAGRVFLPRRGRISDKRFEQQLLTYSNKHLL